MKRKIFAALLLSAFLGCALLSMAAVCDLRGALGSGAACSIAPATSQALSLLPVLFPDLSWTAYAQSARTRIESDAFPARAAEVPVLSFLGAPTRIAFLPLVSGRLPLDGERDACALDANTAFALCKTPEADGALVRWGERTLRVVGVLDLARPLLLTPAERETALDRLVADDREALLSLASALDAEADSFALSGAEWARLAEMFCLIPWIFAAALVLISLRGRGGWRRATATFLLWALVLGAVLALLWRVPVRLLPSRWSDLAFYGEQAVALRGRAPRLADVRDELCRAGMLRAAWPCALACLLLLLKRPHRRDDVKR